MLYGRGFLSQNDHACTCQEKSNARVCSGQEKSNAEHVVVKRTLMLGYVQWISIHACKWYNNVSTGV